jgi:hypothetical protein
MDREAIRLQTVDEPVPVVGRFDHDAGELRLPRHEERHNLRQLIGQSLLGDHPVRFVRHAYYAIVRMQVNGIRQRNPLGRFCVAKCRRSFAVESTKRASGHRCH